MSSDTTLKAQRVVLQSMAARLQAAIGYDVGDLPIIPGDVDAPTPQGYALNAARILRWPRAEFLQWMAAWQNAATALGWFGPIRDWPLASPEDEKYVTSLAIMTLRNRPTAREALVHVNLMLAAIDARLGPAATKARRSKLWSAVGLIALAAIGGGIIYYVRKHRRGQLRGASEGHKVLASVPKGSNLDCSWDELCRWGDKMALVTRPSYAAAAYSAEDEFDPEIPAHKYSVWFTDIPGDDRLVGQRVHFRDPKAKYWETTFTYRDPRDPAYGYYAGGRTGRVVTKQKPETFWVKAKVKQLGPGNDAVVQRKLRERGYVEPDQYRYTLTAKKWRELLAMPSFEQTQQGDDFVASNAANDIVEQVRRVEGTPDTAEDDERIWQSIPGVFTTTKKEGRIKFIVPRKKPAKGHLFGLQGAKPKGVHKPKIGMHFIGDLAQRLGPGWRNNYPAWYVADTSKRGKPERVEITRIRGPLDSHRTGVDYAELADGRVITSLYLFPRTPGFVKPRFIAMRDEYGVSRNWVGLPRGYKPDYEGVREC